MKINTYQEEAARTLPPNTELRAALNLGALGLGGESGEVIDLIKKALFHDSPQLSFPEGMLSGSPEHHAHDRALHAFRDKLRKELGDVLWYVAAIATGAGMTLEEVAEANVAKLRARYPEGFSPEASRARADEPTRRRTHFGEPAPARPETARGTCAHGRTGDCDACEIPYGP